MSKVIDPDWHCWRCKRPAPASLSAEWLAAHVAEGTAGTLNDAAPGLWNPAEDDELLRLL